MFRGCRTARFAKVAVWGGGTMGGGIAQVVASSGYAVSVVEVNADRCNAAQKNISGSLSRVFKKKFETANPKATADEVAAHVKTSTSDVMSKINFSTDGAAVAATSDLIIEAVVENLEVKNQLWKSLDPIAKPTCVFATNTSSLSVAAQAAVTKRSTQFGGLHFFSPVAMMKLVEIVTLDQTDPNVKTQLRDFVTKIGKAPVMCSDTKGFIVNRLLVPYMLEAARLVERGVATVEDVDVAMKLGAGHPMGPFKLCDSVGIDVIKLITDAWHKEEPQNPLFNPVKLIDDKVAAGHVGMKAGEGFYKYPAKK